MPFKGLKIKTWHRDPTRPWCMRKWNDETDAYDEKPHDKIREDHFALLEQLHKTGHLMSPDMWERVKTGGRNSYEQECFYPFLSDEAMLAEVAYFIKQCSRAGFWQTGEPCSTYNEALWAIFAPLLADRLRDRLVQSNVLNSVRRTEHAVEDGYTVKWVLPSARPGHILIVREEEDGPTTVEYEKEGA